jgi:hypothetical protein
LINFLETLEKLDGHAGRIVDVHIKTIRAIIHHGMSGDGGQQGKALRDALTDACNSYYRRKSA